MSCLLAILLFTGSNSGASNRLVLAFEDNYETYHMTYTLNPNQIFPELDESFSIFKSPTTYRQAGTYFATYCSSDKNPSKIHQDLYQLLYRDTGGLLNSPIDNSEREESCFQHIKNESRAKENILRKRGISTKYLQENICPENVIVRLAYNWRITLIKGNKSQPSWQDRSKPLVRLENPLKIENHVENSQFIKNGLINGKLTSLAWFQGHLHLFSWNSKEKMWQLETIPNNVKHNGKLIINFLRAAVPQLKQNMDHVQNLSKEYINMCLNKAANANPESLYSYESYDQTCRSFMSEIEISAAIAAEGGLRESF